MDSSFNGPPQHASDIVLALQRSQAIIEFSPTGQILDVNDNFLRLMGYRREEVLGRHHSIFVCPQQASEPAYQEFWAVLRRGEFQVAAFERVTQSGERVWLQASYNPIFGDNGEVVKILKIAAPLGVRGDRRAAHMRQLRQLISGDHLRIALQPIVDLGGNVVAHEALLRSSLAALPGPLDVLRAASGAGALGLLSEAIIGKVRDRMVHLPKGSLLFLNLHPEELRHPQQLLGRLEALEPWSNRLVLEVTEYTELGDQQAATAAALRARGFRLAVDDLGAGYNSLNTMALLEPEFLKIDLCIVRDIDTSTYKQKLVSLLATFAESTGACLLAEGVETAAEAAALRGLGVHLMQGYHFGRPSCALHQGSAVRQAV